MRIGCCIGSNAKPDDPAGAWSLRHLAECGFEYVEAPLAALMDMTTDQRHAFQAEVDRTGLPVEAMSNFFPGTLRLTGTEVDEPRVREYVREAVALSASLGARIIVFGSGGAKNITAGFPEEQARIQLLDHMRMIAETVSGTGITVVMEPLNRKEANFVTSSAEAWDLICRAAQPEVRLLIDYYHFKLEGESNDVLKTYGREIRHAHLADPSGRTHPVIEGREGYAAFLRTLKEIGYAGRLSMEASPGADFKTAARQGVALIRDILEEIG